MNMADKKQFDAIFRFETNKQRDDFITWLCEQGEQDYWWWMEHPDSPDDYREHTVGFDYWKHTGKFAGKDGQEAVIICTKLGDD
jgi:hypothetical protein